MANPAEDPTSTSGDAEAAVAPELADIAELSYEDARDELVTIVAQLEGGQVGLEESMRLWQRGEALAAHCSSWLDGAEAALTQDDEA
jgi:exodeoxyribonuclease VII small subunit